MFNISKRLKQGETSEQIIIKLDTSTQKVLLVVIGIGLAIAGVFGFWVGSDVSAGRSIEPTAVAVIAFGLLSAVAAGLFRSMVEFHHLIDLEKRTVSSYRRNLGGEKVQQICTFPDILGIVVDSRRRRRSRDRRGDPYQGRRQTSALSAVIEGVMSGQNPLKERPGWKAENDYDWYYGLLLVEKSGRITRLIDRKYPFDMTRSQGEKLAKRMGVEFHVRQHYYADIGLVGDKVRVHWKEPGLFS